MKLIAVAIMVTFTALAAACSPPPEGGDPMLTRVECQSVECQSGVPAPTVVLD